MQPAKQPDGNALNTALVCSEGILQAVVEIFIALDCHV